MITRPSQKHHYIPEFYLKQWAGSDGRLCEFSRPYDKVIAKMKHPGATGYSRGLYTIKGAPPNLADAFENKYLSVADGLAATSLRVMVNEKYVPTGDQKIAWTRFMMSLIYRTPEGVERTYTKIKQYYASKDVSELQKRYSELRAASDPQTIEEYVRSRGEPMVRRTMITHLLDIIESDKVRDKIMEMHWHMAEIRGMRYPLLSSDRPLIMTNGIAYSHSHIVMPLSPYHIFIAANSDDEVRKIKQLAQNGELVSRMNDKMGRQARKFVYGIDNRQLRFVENRLGEKAVCSPFE